MSEHKEGNAELTDDEICKEWVSSVNVGVITAIRKIIAADRALRVPDGWIVYFAGQLTDQIFDSKVEALNYVTKMGNKYGDEDRRELRAFYFRPQSGEQT